MDNLESIEFHFPI